MSPAPSIPIFNRTLRFAAGESFPSRSVMSLEAVIDCDAVGGRPPRKTNHSVLRLDDVVHIESVQDVLTPGERAPAAIVGLNAELQIQQRVTRHEVQRRAADRGRCQALVRHLSPYEARPLIGQRVLVVDTR